MKAKTATAAPSKTQGRPRSDEARRQILEAAYTLLKEKPTNAITAQQIAEEAGVSTATLYRWWKTKEKVLFEACLERLKTGPLPGKKGSPGARLHESACNSAKWMRSESGRVMARIIGGIQGDEELRRSYLAKFYAPRRQSQRRLVEEAIAAGELKPGTNPELLIDALFGPLFFRWINGHAPVDQAFADAVANAALRMFAR
ncbi:MAG: TetR/AcrR family transcriptional regulator [Alphaproteobacteria bacterium]|nr:TetR/AcrR family transcriptional regulator [Alphaproteobacteria bacterium]MDE2162411.1 TetR/AcrR family transcriptional regulator [Alphaproteobacteria bacterium]MDE2501084.1 TetR/AcrR family transcriptional regulator [Alphaproteobacteria bacterium]